MNRILFSLAALVGALMPLVFDSALKGAALLAVAALTALAMWRASAAARHLVWLVAVVALLIVPVLSVALPQWHVLPGWAAAPVIERAAPAPPPARNDPSDQAHPSDPSDPSDPSPRPAALEPQPSIASVSRTPTEAPTAPLAPAPHPAPTWRDWLPLAWCAGFAMLALRLLAAHLLLRRASRHCPVLTAPPDEKIAGALAEACKQLGITQCVVLLLDTRRTIPVVWGVFRPRLMLPIEAREWSDDQLRSVLLHELAHIKRRDTLVQWLTQIACALHWWNPLVWLAAWRLHAERERACDDLVLASGVRPSAYAEHLLHVATKLSPARWTAACGLAMARKSSLEGRLMAVLSEKLNRAGITRALTAAALILGALIAIPLAMLRAADEKERDGKEYKTDSASAWVRNENGKPAYIVFSPFKWNLRVSGYHHSNVKEWNESCEITLPGGEVADLRVENPAPKELTYRKQTYDFAKGRVFLVRADATVRQLDIPAPLITKREQFAELAKLLAGSSKPTGLGEKAQSGSHIYVMDPVTLPQAATAFVVPDPAQVKTEFVLIGFGKFKITDNGERFHEPGKTSGTTRVAGEMTGPDGNTFAFSHEPGAAHLSVTGEPHGFVDGRVFLLNAGGVVRQLPMSPATFLHNGDAVKKLALEIAAFPKPSETEAPKSAEAKSDTSKSNAKGRGRILDRNSVVLAESTGDGSRYYPYKALAAHAIGFISPTDGGSALGRTGSEKMFNDTLAKGEDVSLSIDARIQSLVEKTLIESGVGRASVVLLDLKSGGVLASASIPCVDSNALAGPVAKSLWDEWSANESKPLANRAQIASAPGSVFKLVTAAAAARAGISDKTVFDCTGSVTYGNRAYKCWIGAQGGKHGKLDLSGAIKASCNCYFYQLAEKVGLQQLDETAHLLGLGERSLAGFPDAASGFIPSAAWAKEGGIDLSPGFMANTGIGQGYVTATPLQLATMTGFIATAGRSPRTHLMLPMAGELGVIDLGKSGLPPEAFSAIREAMVRNVNEDGGTGKQARSAILKIAGKTGSVQHILRTKQSGQLRESTGWFVAYAPADAPRFSIAVMVEGGRSGGGVCAPIARRILERAIGELPAPQAIEETKGHLDPIETIHFADSNKSADSHIPVENGSGASQPAAQPKNQYAHAHFAQWQKYARENGDIPGGLIAMLGRSILVDDDPKFPDLQRRCDGSHDWTAQEAADLIDAIAGTDNWLNDEGRLAGVENLDITTNGKPLPPELAALPWGDADDNFNGPKSKTGLRAAFTLDPAAASYTQGSALPVTVHFHNSGTAPLVFPLGPRFMDMAEARDEQGRKIFVQPTRSDSVTVQDGPTAPRYSAQLAPGHWISFTGARLTLAAGQLADSPDSFGNVMFARAGSTVRLRWMATAATWRDVCAQKPLEWKERVAQSFERVSPTPKSRTDRERIIRRMTSALTGVEASEADVAAFVADESPDALAKLIARIQSLPPPPRFVGWLKTGEQTFTVTPGAADYRGTVMTATGTGAHEVDDSVILSLREDGGYFELRPPQTPPHPPLQFSIARDAQNLAIPHGLVWRHGSRVVWVAEKARVRKLDLTVPGKLTKTDLPAGITSIPEELRAELVKVFPAVTTAAAPAVVRGLDLKGLPSHPASPGSPHALSIAELYEKTSNAEDPWDQIASVFDMPLPGDPNGTWLKIPASGDTFYLEMPGRTTYGPIPGDAVEKLKLQGLLPAYLARKSPADRESMLQRFPWLKAKLEALEKLKNSQPGLSPITDGTSSAQVLRADGQRRKVDWSQPPPMSFFEGKYDPELLTRLVAKPGKDGQEIWQLSEQILRAAVEKDPQFRHLLKDEELKAQDTDSRILTMSLAAYDYSVVGNKDALKVILDRLGDGTSEAYLAAFPLGFVDEWEASIPAMQKCFVRADGAKGEERGRFWIHREWFFPDRFAAFQDKELAKIGLNAGSLHGVWQGAKDDVTVKIWFGVKPGWEVKKGNKLVQSALITSPSGKYDALGLAVPVNGKTAEGVGRVLPGEAGTIRLNILWEGLFDENPGYPWISGIVLKKQEGATEKPKSADAGQRRKVDWSKFPGHGERTAPFDAAEALRLAALPEKTEKECRRLMYLILKGAAEKAPELRPLLKAGALKRGSKEFRDFAPALAAYDYSVNGNKAALRSILDELAKEPVGSDTWSAAALDFIDEWDLSMAAFEKHYSGNNDGSRGDCIYLFWATRKHAFPEGFARFQARRLAASKLDAESLRGVWKGSKDGVSVELRLGEKQSWEITHGDKLIAAELTTEPWDDGKAVTLEAAREREGSLWCGQLQPGDAGTLRLEVWQDVSEKTPGHPRVTGIVLTKQKRSEEPKVVSIAKDGTLRMNDKAFTLDELKAEAEREPGRPFVIRGGKDVPYAKVLEVLEALQNAGVKNVGISTAALLTPESLLGTWRGKLNDKRLVLSFHRPPVETDVRLDAYEGDATIGLILAFSIEPDGSAVTLTGRGDVKYGRLVPTAEGGLKLELHNRQKGQTEVVLTRDAEPAATEPRQKEARELFAMWKRQASEESDHGTIPYYLIDRLADEVRAFVQANPNLDSASKLPRLLPRFATDVRDSWSPAEGMKLLDDVAYYSTKPIEAYLARERAMEQLIGTWEGTVNGRAASLWINRGSPVTTAIGMEMRYPADAEVDNFEYSVALDGVSIELRLYQIEGKPTPFGRLARGTEDTLRLTLKGKDEGFILSRKVEPLPTEPKEQAARELFKMWKATANEDGTIPGTFIGALATEVRAFGKEHRGRFHADNMVKLLPRFITSRGWTQAEAIKLLDDVAYYSIAPIAARVAKLAKLPDDSYAKVGVPIGDVDEHMEWSGEEQDGLCVGMRIAENAEWRIGGEVKVELWACNPGEKDEKFQYCPRRDIGLRVFLRGADGKEHAAEIAQFRGYPVFSRALLPAGHIFKVKEFSVVLLPPDKKAAGAEPHFTLPAGDYKFRCEVKLPGTTGTDAAGKQIIPAEGEWTGTLKSKEFGVQLVAADAPKAKASADAKPEPVKVPDDQYVKAGFPADELVGEGVMWNEVQNGMSLGYRITGDEWRILGKGVKVELWVQNFSGKDVKFQTIARPDIGLRMTLKDETGVKGAKEGEYESNIVPNDRPPFGELRLLPPRHALKVKEFTVSLLWPENDVSGIKGHYFLTKPGGYKFQCELELPGFSAAGEGGKQLTPAAGEWTGKLTTSSRYVAVIAPDAPAPKPRVEYMDVDISKDGEVSLFRKKMPLDELTTRAARNAKKRFTIRADEDVPYAKVVELVDALKAVGVTEISFSEARMGDGKYRVANRTAAHKLDDKHGFSMCRPDDYPQFFTVRWPAEGERPARWLRTYPKVSKETQGKWAVVWEPGTDVLWWVDDSDVGKMTLTDPMRVIVDREGRGNSFSRDFGLPDGVVTEFRRLGFSVGRIGQTGGEAEGNTRSQQILSAEHAATKGNDIKKDAGAPAVPDAGQGGPRADVKPNSKQLFNEAYSAFAVQSEKDVNFVLIDQGGLSNGISEWSSGGNWRFNGNVYLVDRAKTVIAGKNVNKRLISVKYASDDPTKLYLDGKAYALDAGRVFLLGDVGEPLQLARSMALRSMADLVKIGDFAVSEMKRLRPAAKPAGEVPKAEPPKNATLPVPRAGGDWSAEWVTFSKIVAESRGTPDAKLENVIAWGKEDDGLQSGLLMPGRAKLGEKVNPLLVMRNVSGATKEMTVCTSLNVLEPSVRSADGNASIKSLKVWLTGTDARFPVTLKAGEHIEFPAPPVVFGIGRDADGTPQTPEWPVAGLVMGAETVRVKFHLGNVRGPETGEVTVEVKAPGAAAAGVPVRADDGIERRRIRGEGFPNLPNR